MSDYPDPDEEFELMYGDEYDLLREQEDEELFEPPAKTTKTSVPSTHSSNNTIIQTSQGPDNVYEGTPSLFSTQEPSQLRTESLPASTSTLNHSFETSQLDNFQNNIQETSSRKRNADELFGDIGDLDIEDFDIETQPQKKQKPSKEEEMRELMEHILLLRKLNKEKLNILSGNKDYSTINIDRDKYNITYRVPKYPFIGVRRFDGERVYVRFHSEEYEKEEIQKIVKESAGDDILGSNSKKIWDDAKALLENQVTDQLNEDDEDITEIGKSEENKQLWTDLYRPRKYIELLSDESTNRIMLKWLKLWDKVVFNRRPRVKPVKPLDSNQSKFSKFELNTDLDEHGRPQYKVALLCGPPGLGKTTLAHVAAKHAGYNVVEINASDDRSTEAFKTSLESATQMKSVVDRDGRPNCLIFDEIDGAPQASIDFLIKFINGTNSTKSKKGKCVQKGFILKRPIICICNDVYVPALRPLRQIAFVINFPATSSVRLAERLMCICRREMIKTDLGAMMALAEKSGNDIRSCLSVLYFFKAQKKTVTLSNIYKANIGQKDVQKGLFAVWSEIFHIQKPKENPHVPDRGTSHKQTTNARMANILQTISSFGDHDKVAQGVYENFPLLKIKNSTLQGLTKALDWFVFSDCLNQQIYTLQNYTLFSYLSYAFVVWHFLFATPNYQKLTYPSKGYETKQKEIRTKAIVTEVLKGMQPSIRAYCQRLPLVLDILPLLMRIIVPDFRPVSLHLYTKEEKDIMFKVINVMIDYNLNYVQERLPDGSYVFNLEPNIEELMCVEKSSTSKKEIKTLSYSNKLLVSREIELEKMRRFERLKTVEPTEESRKIAKKQEQETAKEQPLPNHLQRLHAKKIKTIKQTVAKDFFGRVITKSTSTGKTSAELQNDIWYQYKEGYNNAVRKNLKISNLL